MWGWGGVESQGTWPVGDLAALSSQEPEAQGRAAQQEGEGGILGQLPSHQPLDASRFWGWRLGFPGHR